VYENRQTRQGRIIELHVIVVGAKHPSGRAVAEIAGGPGEAATDYPPYILSGDFGKARLALHDTYDMIFMDDRGMGQSNPLNCDIAPPANPDVYFRYGFSPQVVKQCRDKSAQTHDLAQYNTTNAVDDLDDVRAALGYPKIVLDGGSYGTFMSMVYVRRHPEHVEAALLDGVTAPGSQTLLGSPDGAQQALDDLFKKCAADKRCRLHYPLFRAHFYAVLQRLDGDLLQVPVRNPVKKYTQTVSLTKEVFVDQVRHVLYDPFASAYLPFIIERAYRRDYAPLGKMIQTVTVGLDQGQAMGANLAYTCADMIPFVTAEQLANARAHSFVSDLRIRAQQRACAIWNVPAMPASFNDPVRSDVPVLMILGSDDPATPPKYGEQALKYLPNGRAVLVKGAGHGADNACTDKLVLRFLHADSAKGLNVSQCTASFDPPPFAISMKGWP
jgi:pimeloyl-ACP methyl ester carboxylesterase